MAILFELSEEMVKQASLIASKYSDRTLLSIIEECFNYGVRSLYSDAPKPVPPQRKLIHEYFRTPVSKEIIEDLQQSIDSVAEQAQQDIEGIVYSEEEIPDSLGKPVLSSEGLFEL